jgi:hypothetical protein
MHVQYHFISPVPQSAHHMAVSCGTGGTAQQQPMSAAMMQSTASSLQQARQLHSSGTTGTAV